MPLRKATQAVISPNVCTTDTDQTITGNKIFSNPIQGNVDGILTGNVIGSASLNVLKTGDTMTGALNVPAGSTGSQVPRASEVVLKTGDTMTGALNVPAGATGSQVPRISEVVAKTGDTMTGGLFVSTNTSTDALRITQIGTGAALLVEDSTNPDTSPLIVTATGNVGIGKLVPSQKLDVVGNIACTGNIIINGSVFDNSLYPSFFARIKGDIADITSITSITYVPNGSGADVTMTKTSHGLLVDDSITFVGQTGNNAALNGTWKINAADANTFTFSIPSYPASLSAAGITASFPIRIARFISVFDSGYVNSSPNSIGKTTNGTYQINFYDTRDNADYLAFGNACDSGVASGIFSPFGYSTQFFSFRTYTIGTSTLDNFSDINIQIY